LVCALCYLGTIETGWEYRATTTDLMVAHLIRHVEEGHHVPDYVVPNLLMDDGVNFGGRAE
jgi:hypothetical protein